ncbi:MAG: hypothetical protein RMK34_02805 [Tepidimonas sp.]|uniref:hypothetical protein n=1 Tax=Tepidimonas sp. TaxID=2002775 RepID=UPI00298EE9CB|nr:hypothetical protein [Tepidimonas sp.]MCS6811222.1 hypothetical protein [Tepidimonas sp.]MDW8335879.1 hypothetical protein [Tepidimonas sp.]
MIPLTDPASLEPLLAGTLVLLHHQATRDAHRPPCPYAAHKLALNLHRLANHPALSEPMAVVLARLSAVWRERAHVAAVQANDEGDDEGSAARARLH